MSLFKSLSCYHDMSSLDMFTWRLMAACVPATLATDLLLSVPQDK